jgi:hypothetical protein
MNWRSIALALLLLAFTGCVMSLGELRQQPPAQTATIPNQQYDVLAGCVAEGLQTADRRFFGSTSDLLYQAIHRPEQRRATVTGYVEPARPLLDVTFVQRDGAVLVESREAEWRGNRLNALAWPIIEQCAPGATPTSSKP